MTRDGENEAGEGGNWKRQPPAADVWQAFEANLALALPELEEDEFLIISYKRANYFVQFAGQGGFGMRAEASSDAYIVEGQPQLPGAARLLRKLGWDPPTHSPTTEDADHPAEGSPNYYLDLGKPVDYHALAGLAVRTLRDVYGIGHPGELEYESFGDGRCFDSISDAGDQASARLTGGISADTALRESFNRSGNYRRKVVNEQS